ncbi:protein sel-1 homolog 3 isoform X2 [Antennarius striatus]|uniref:protein sel-1 homolog 3 isoform X2 n=1 Tax=Antennarius striatus TaxID=241820 RepID=UPI0035AF1D0A
MDLQKLQLHTVQGLDQVTLLNPPEEPLSEHHLKILYSCDELSTVQLECVIYFDTGIISTLQLKQWSCAPGNPKIRTVELKLPDWLVYQSDGILPDSQWVLSCMLLVSIRHRGFDDSKRSVAVQDVATLQLKPFFSRPVKQHQLCIAWSWRMLQLTPCFAKKQCPFEQETVHFLASIFASSGKSYGITKSLDPYGSEALEFARTKTISFAWCMFSIWIFVSRSCQKKLCGVFHHINSKNNFVTPSVFLRNSGELHIQVDLNSKESSAFISSFKVPLKEWCQISLMLEGPTVTVSLICFHKDLRTVHTVDHQLERNAELDDTEGTFVIGGRNYIQSVEGYFGPMVYYRNRIPHYSTSEVVLPDLLSTVNLTGWLQACRTFRLEVTVKVSGYILKAKEGTELGTCFDAFHEWTGKERQPSQNQCLLWEATVPKRRQAAKLAKFLAFKHGERGVSLLAVGRALYSLSLHKLDRARHTGTVSRILPLLLQAGCLADNRALHMSSVLYSTGLGIKKQPEKVWLLALLAAQKDDRLALLHLGHLHHQGLLGLPADPDLSYAYYANIAEQTVEDRQSPTSEQTFVEAVHLNHDHELSLQTNKDHHIFEWLKLQARRGAAEAEQTVARMLFWGQQGVTPNIQEAVKHYERGAVQWEDPTSMFDYGIVLLQGLGVKKDVPKAISFLRKAMDKGFVPAMNALGWYFEHFERDYRRAVQLWEQADLLKSPDAALNLGVIHSQGLYPGKPADKFMAYQYYLKSAQRGHIRGAVLLANIWNTGIPGRVKRRPSEAVLRAKQAAEQNGYLGTILRKALNSYLKNDMLNSLLYYMMAAESGYAAAQFNAAYLCENNAFGYLDPDFAASCMWRYYNLTIQSQNPNTYALVRMGDLLYQGQGHKKKDLFSAAEKYTQAALRNEPQGWYNLGLLAEEGFRLPLSVIVELGLSELYMSDNSTLLSALYRRCRDSEDSDSYLPCSLALVNVYLRSFTKDHGAVIKFSTAVAMVIAPTIFLIIFNGHRRPVPVLSFN